MHESISFLFLLSSFLFVAICFGLLACGFWPEKLVWWMLLYTEKGKTTKIKR